MPPSNAEGPPLDSHSKRHDQLILHEEGHHDWVMYLSKVVKWSGGSGGSGETIYPYRTTRVKYPARISDRDLDLLLVDCR